MFVDNTMVNSKGTKHRLRLKHHNYVNLINQQNKSKLTKKSSFSHFFNFIKIRTRNLKISTHYVDNRSQNDQKKSFIFRYVPLSCEQM